MLCRAGTQAVGARRKGEDMHLDEINRRIIELLKADARLPLKTLAAEVGLARSSVRERIDRMEKAGIIRGYHADIAPEAMGAALQAHLLVRLTKTPARDTVSRIIHLPGVAACASLTGDTDLIVSVSVADTEALNRLRDTIASLPHIADLTTAIVLRDEMRG